HCAHEDEAGEPRLACTVDGYHPRVARDRVLVIRGHRCAPRSASYRAGASLPPIIDKTLPSVIWPGMNIPPLEPSFIGRYEAVIVSPALSVVLVQPRRARKLGLIPSKP